MTWLLLALPALADPPTNAIFRPKEGAATV